ncbi:hypothetical protein N7472_008922 [Penicillium cf. griseofulvum]|uniref:Uncharacterized protein n=1 Tax=Penicillium cf. griseofulvum TaxID=2972120 RepID=A0A9W9M5R9_9EURO|nr:hypothetical protein N7472_008922 [Penicillium cf. griseofulvum]
METFFAENLFQEELLTWSRAPMIIVLSWMTSPTPSSPPPIPPSSSTTSLPLPPLPPRCPPPPPPIRMRTVCPRPLPPLPPPSSSPRHRSTRTRRPPQYYGR